MISLKTKDWEINNIETILFDKDGTFIDLHYFWGKMTELRAKEVIERFNINEIHFPNICKKLGYDIYTKKMIKDGITALYSRVKIIEIFTNYIKEYRAQTTENEIEKIFDDVSNIFYKNMNEYTRPIDKAIEFIEKVNKQNIRIGIVTSDSIISTEKTLKYFGWDSFFRTVIGRESSKHTKESGEPTKLALKVLNADPKTTIMIGDAPMDYISAKNANIEKTILVATGQISKNDLLKTSQYTVSSLAEIEIINE